MKICHILSKETVIGRPCRKIISVGVDGDLALIGQQAASEGREEMAKGLTEDVPSGQPRHEIADDPFTSVWLDHQRSVIRISSRIGYCR